MFAIIKTGGKQYKVKAKDRIKVEKLPKSKDDKVIFKDVLLVADGKGKVELGKPTLSKVKVEATILKEVKDKKVKVVKYKPKTRYKRTIGHRQVLSEVRIDSISA